MRPARMTVALVWVFLMAASCPGAAFAGFADRNSRKEGRRGMQELFDKAVNSTGQQYLDAEQALFSAGAPVTGVLQQNLQNPDPVASLIARVLLDWKQGRGEEFNRANEYLNGLPNRLARTPITAPPPVGVAGYLSQNFGPRVAEFLAVRLLKEGGWPGWRTAGVLLYLRQQAVPSTTAALIRFASQTDNSAWRDTAVAAIKEAHDPALPAKLAAERQRAESRHEPVPLIIADLEKVK